MAQVGVKPSKKERKANRKTTRKLSSLLSQEKDLQISSEPTNYVFVGNGGLMCGIDRVNLLQLFQRYGPVQRLDLFSGKSFSLVTYVSIESASEAYEMLNGRKLLWPQEFYKKDQIFYLAFLRSIPRLLFTDQSRLPTALVATNEDGSFSASQTVSVPGLHLLDDFVSEREEQDLITFFTSSNELASSKTTNCDNKREEKRNDSAPPLQDRSVTNSAQHNNLKHRRVHHFGYEFRYDTNNVDKNNPLLNKIPSLCTPLLDKMKTTGYVHCTPDQLTVNHYEPGQGIPPHVDTHSAFEDGIISLSLGSQVVMDFRHPDGHHIPMFVPARSLLIMTGESRYLWSHGITPRKYDIVSEDSQTGSTTLKERSLRISLTFRKVRFSSCDCQYPSACDSRGFLDARKGTSQDTQLHKVPSTSSEANSLESKHVHDVYEKIATHFSDTRHSPWPKIAKFLKGLPPHSLVGDIGCGNGKYLGINPDIHMFGSDRSFNLSSICMERGYSVTVSDILDLPYRDMIFDACICIAVIHHLSTEQRRLDAIKELVRIVKPGGLILVSVWALEQDLNEKHSEQSLMDVHANEERLKKNVPENAEIISPDGDQESVTQLTERCSDEEKQSEADQRREKTIVINKQRNVFEQQDLFVPWNFNKGKEKHNQESSDIVDKSSTLGKDSVFQRFYHVFKRGELETLSRQVDNVDVAEVYYDKGNWCVVLKKCR